MGALLVDPLLLALAAPEDALAFNATQLVALTRLPALVLVVAALALALWLSLRGTRGAPRDVRVGLFALRALLGLAVLALLFEPGLRKMATSREANRVVIAVDTSESMAHDDGSGQTRVGRALAAKRQIEADLAEQSAPFVTEVLAFDGRARPLSTKEEADLEAGAKKPEGAATDLSAALDAVSTGEGQRPLGGVVVISDGADTTGLSAALTPELRAKLGALGAPVHTVLTGSEATFKDIALERVLADDFAFVRNQVKVQVVIRHSGFSGLDVPITLREDGRPLLVQPVKLSEGDETLATFSFEPKSAGKHVYTLAAPVHPDEDIAENNRVDFTLKVIRDRIRVLQVAGRPSWDQRFVRRLLKENPSVDLISFFILRSPTDVAGAGNQELSLIPFPTRELFTEELHTFDVVIFQDFNYRPYQMGLYLKNVKEFVENAGGGFLMIGGELSFSEGDYDGTPIADILPVELLPGHGHLSEERFRPLLTEAGRSHPITDLGDVVGSGDPFRELPELEGVNLVAGLKEGAEALLAHPYLNASGKPHPVVAVREAGKGRSMAILTDSTWTWSLPHVGAGGRGDAHRRFLANSLRWLIRDPELSRVKVNLAEASYEPGAPVSVEVRSYDAKYEAEGGAEVRLVFTPLDALSGGAGGEIVQEGSTGKDGLWQTELLPPGPGAWRVRAVAKKDGRAIGSDENAFVVKGARAEQLHTEPRPDLLQALAGAGAGRFVEADDTGSLSFKDHGKERVHRQRTEPLWNHWLPVSLVALLACAEWWWRRRRGFA